MRIGFFTDTYLPRRDGTVTSVTLLARHLRAAGHEVWVFAPRHGKYRDTDRYVSRFASVPLPFQTDYRLTLPVPLRLHREIAEIGLDIVHTHIPFPAGMMGVWHARRLGIPSVHTYHINFQEFVRCIPLPHRMLLPWVRRSSRWYCNAHDLVIAPSAFIREVLVDFGVSRPMVVVPTGVDTTRFEDPRPARARRMLGLDSHQPLLLYVGRLSVEKNLEFLVDAFARVRQEVPEAHLALLGEGPRRKQLAARAEAQGVAAGVSLPGPVAPEAVADFYAAASLLVFPSTGESQGIVIDEARMCGLPAVALNVGAMPEAVQHGVNGLLVPPDLQAYSSAVTRCLTNRSVLDGLRQGARQAAPRADGESYTRAVLNAYASALGGGKTAESATEADTTPVG